MGVVGDLHVMHQSKLWRGGGGGVCTLLRILTRHDVTSGFMLLGNIDLSGILRLSVGEF